MHYYYYYYSTIIVNCDNCMVMVSVCTMNTVQKTQMHAKETVNRKMTHENTAQNRCLHEHNVSTTAQPGTIFLLESQWR